MKATHLGTLWWLVIAGCAAGVLIAMFGSFRTGGYVIAAAVAFAGLARAVLPSSLTSGLTIRGRMLDVFFYALAAAALAVIFTEVRLGAAF